MSALIGKTVFWFLLSIGTCNILELGPEFGDQNALEEPHLVMFYAPWCGHCKSLHPIWYELGNRLSRYPITIARIDATLYRSAAERYNVRGFPTIRLIGNDRIIDYVGDRTMEALSEFAIKGSRPLLPIVGSLGKLNDLKKSDDVVFLAVGISENIKECLTLVSSQTVYEAIIAEVSNSAVVKVDNKAKTHFINDMTEMRSDLSISRTPGILVLKDNKVFEYMGNLEIEEDCLEIVDWVKSERFSAFQAGSYPVIHPLLYLKYNIVFYYGEEESRVAELKSLATQREVLPDNFYFVHVDKAEYIENLISAYAEVGSVIVYNPQTEQYAYSKDPNKPVKALLEEYSKNKVPLHGGAGFLANCRKVWFRISSNIWPLFVDHPFIMGLVIVMPIGLILVCCCDGSGSKDDPIRQVRASESHMDILWNSDSDKKEVIEEEVEEEENEAKENETEEIEDKDPELKKDE